MDEQVTCKTNLYTPFILDVTIDVNFLPNFTPFLPLFGGLL
jgi:hypothetical protein